MTAVSTIAMWFADNTGFIEISWLGWQIETSLSIFALIILITFFAVYVIFKFTHNVFLLPLKLKKSFINRNKKKAEMALEEGLLASVYGDSQRMIRSYALSKKYLKQSPLLLLLKLQNGLIKKNEVDCFNTFKKMLDFPASSPIAIRGLISLATKNSDKELFSNILNSAKLKKVSLNYFIDEAFNFCIKNDSWEVLKNFSSNEKKKDYRNMKTFLSFIDFKLAEKNFNKGNLNEASYTLKKIISNKVLLPPVVDMYFKLNFKSSRRNLKKILKDYWKFFPNENILDLILNYFKELNILEKVKLLTEVLHGHDNLYFKYLMLGKIKAKAKIWGDSKKDLLKSIEIFPNKKAFLTLISIEEETSYNKKKIEDWLMLSKSCQEKLWMCQSCMSLHEKWNINCKNCNSLFSLVHQSLGNPIKNDSRIISSKNFLKIANV